MNSTPVEQGQDWDNDAEDAHGDPTMHRRRLLGKAGFGLALAASGLFLPEWLAETEAREGALGGAKGGRRGKNRRGRDRKRRHGDKNDERKDRDKPRGDVVPTHPDIYVVNWRSAPVQTRGFDDDQAPHWHVRDGWDWQAIEAITPDDHYRTRDFASDGETVVVQIGTDRVVWFQFHWPWNPEVLIYSGGWDRDGLTGRGSILVGPTRLAIDDSVSTPGITATRIQDTNSHVRLRVRLT